MSMNIDESKPLTEAERRYLLERNQNDKVAALDAKFADWDGDEDDEATGRVDYTTWKKADLKAEIERRAANGRVFELPAKPTVAQYAEALDEDDADGDDEDDATDE